ncbi:MAG: 16S rRNA (adenine(1518)-N(6)/adenine(1519)-N(6)) -dimethyltransferase RsmA [Francisella sp.]
MQYKTKAKKSLGQNFLQDENIIHKIINLANIKKSDFVVEIGPGLGALTRYLLLYCDNVNVIELDSSIIDLLIENCKDYGIPNVYNANFLNFDFSCLNTDKKIKLIGNLPYNISSPILFKVIQYCDLISDAHFMLQKEVVERIVSVPNNKSYGRLSVILQYHFDCSIVLKVPPEVFYPKPKVDSAILRLKPKVNKAILKNYDFFENIVKTSFAQRRKTLHNNFKDILKTKNINYDKIPVDLSKRAENLSVEDFVKLANFLIEA